MRRYDPLGRLYEVAGAATTTRFLYDGDALVAEYNTAGNMLRRYIHGANPQADDPLVWYEGATIAPAAARLLKADHQGSIVAASDWYGTLLSINGYDEYGIPNAGNAGRFQYTGQAWLEELGMYHYKARIYSPTLGRFLQTDPVGYDDQVNLYAYVGNDPINHTDPTGTETVADNDRDHSPQRLIWRTVLDVGRSYWQTTPMGAAQGLAQDVVRAFQNPTFRNVAPVVIGVAPWGRVASAVTAASRFATAASAPGTSPITEPILAARVREPMSEPQRDS